MEWRIELPDESYSVPNIQILFWIYLKKHGEKTDNPSIKTYVNKVENRVTFKIKTVYYFKLIMPETINNKSKITADKSSENDLGTTKVVLIHSNNVNNVYQQDSIVLYSLIPNKSFGQWLDISLKIFIFLKTFNSELLHLKVWFIDKHSKLLEIVYGLNMTFFIA